MQLNELNDSTQKRQSRKRVARGIGSGTGKTAGRGHKGQKSRSGVSIKGFEGGQMPINRRLPKRGFTNANRVEFESVNTGMLQAAFDAKKLKKTDTVNREKLIEVGLVRKSDKPVKLLAKGDISAPLKIEVDKASAAAQEKIDNAGGSVTVLNK